jgi:Na+-transporting methylmalonyl-CoA/oxaloacetate decarboxylase beta subunit
MPAGAAWLKEIIMKEKKKKRLRWGAGISGALALGCLACRGVLEWLLQKSLAGELSPGPGEGAAALGIIGGADGPTAIFVTRTAEPDWLLWAGGGLALLAVFLFMKQRRV